MTTVDLQNNVTSSDIKPVEDASKSSSPPDQLQRPQNGTPTSSAATAPSDATTTAPTAGVDLTPTPTPPPPYDPEAIVPLGKIGTQWFPYEWTLPGVYAVFDANETIQYVGLSKNCAGSIESHMQTLNNPQICAMAQVFSVEKDAPKDKPAPSDQYHNAIARQWISATMKETGLPPQGNRKDSLYPWRAFKPNDPMLTKPNITFPESERDESKASENIKNILSAHKVVFFMKGSRQEPKCKYSRSAVSLLMNLRYDFECIDCLNTELNPGLRDAIKAFSSWPTIPQLYINSKLIGGTDIINSMVETKELLTLLEESGAPKIEVS